MKIELEFYECETDGDLNWYKDAIIESGGIVIDGRLDYEAELGYINVEIRDKEDFWERFNKTDQGGFLN